ncbi:MAG: SIR2 family protein [Parcubacteria group bacterium]|nr:SIR2 family protein [Parcubacteria group bacterium]
MKNILTIVIGAGASHDCVNENITNVASGYKPPLVGDLFENRPSFSSILSRFPRAAGLSDEIRTKMSEDISIETILREFSDEEIFDLKKAYWQIPLYLQELLREVSNNYVKDNGGTKFNTLIREAEKSNYKKILVLTLNYDLLFEKAFEITSGLKFGHIEVAKDYISKGKGRWSLIKLHGSVNWTRKILNLDKAGSNQDILNALNSLTTELELDDKVLNNQNPFGSGTIKVSNKFHYYPAIAAPIEGKDIFICPAEHIAEATKHLSECSDFLFIGFSGRDENVLDLFKIIPKVNKVKIVNGKLKSGENVLKRLKKCDGGFSKYNNLEGCVSPGGFVEFMGNESKAFWDGV